MTRKTEGLKGRPFVVRLNQQMRKALKRIADKRGEYVSDVIREAVRVHVERIGAERSV